MALFTLLIGTRNRPEALKRCLDSVFAQDYTEPIPLIILDDASDQFSLKEWVPQQYPHKSIEVLRSENSLGVAGGRNLLMEQAETPWVFILDDDAYLEDPTLFTKIHTFLTSDHPARILAMKIIDHDETGGEQLKIPFSRAHLKREPALANTCTPVSYFLGGGHMIHKEVLEKCGLYQSDLVFGGEELDLSYRALSQDFSILYQPEFVVHHKAEKSNIGASRSELYYRLKNRFALAYKYLPLYTLPTYLTYWVLAHVWIYRNQGSRFRTLFQACWDGLRAWPQLQRTPIPSKTKDYLKKNYGRLWY